jgi:tRNA modification GTPase trmE
MYDNETIVAPATSTGKSSVNIIRLSGVKSLAVAESIFMPKKYKISENPRRMIYGHIIDKDKVIDEVMLCYMKAPHSFTCEDVVEINCHGGSKSLEEIMSLILTKGVRLAQNGEFTKRAFLNGRIDLSQAEAVIDIINARSTKSFENAQRQLQGRLSGRIEKIDERLKKSIAQITVAIDFPEEDIPEVTYEELLSDVEISMDELNKLKETYKNGKVISDGINIAIIGRPNVGKSSLLNELLEENRAIVTDIAGTTRDIITESLSINGISVNLIDTAGIRETQDIVEKIGVERSISSIENADIILLVLDTSDKLNAEDRELMEKLKDRQYLILLNKSDLQNKLNISQLPSFIDKDNIINISTLDKRGIEELKENIYAKAVSFDDDSINNVMITNSRHYSLIENAINSLKDARQSLLDNVELDILEIDFLNAVDYLGQITGKSVSESLLDTIFSKFCIGK